jgi:hypothetical protein
MVKGDMYEEYMDMEGYGYEYMDLPLLISYFLKDVEGWRCKYT